MQLIGLKYSPWTEKAAWALDHHGLVYDKIAHQPILGEPRLRWLLKQWRGPVTVPVLIDGDLVLDDSEAIAHHADRLGDGSQLFCHAGTHALVAAAERGLLAARAAALPRLLGNREALRELVPRAIRKRLGAGAWVMGAVGVRRTMRKYKIEATDEARWTAELTEILGLIRRQLGDHGGDYVLGDLSYADMALAQVVNFAFPTDAMGPLRIGGASRVAYTDPVLAFAWPDVRAWRDRLYARHR